MEICPQDTNHFLNSLTYVWQQGGWVGVDLFFVLSGFLISGLLFREHQKHGYISFKSFFIRRGLKIYPPFVVLILVTVLVKIVKEGGFSYDSLSREILFLQNYGGGLWNHTWSLAVEEHFYLFLPIILIFFLKVKPSSRQPFAWIPIVFATTAFLCLSLRLYTMAYVKPYNHMSHLFPTHLRMDSLFCGVAIGYFHNYFPNRFQHFSTRYKKYLLPVAVLLFVPAFAFKLETTPFISTYGLSLFWLGSGLSIFCLMSSEPKSSRIVDTTSFIGSRSYSIYLWHMAVATWGTELLRKLIGGYWNWYLYAGSYLVGSIVLGIVMSIMIEYPVLQFRDRLCPSRSQPLKPQV